MAQDVPPRCAAPKTARKNPKPRRGFVSTTLAPVNCRQEPRFGVMETVLIMVLVFGTVVLMRLILAT